MAKNKTTTEEQGPPSFSEADKGRARQWFKKAGDLREKRDYDYAIECFITGLGYWPEAVEDGHMPLRSLAIQRQQAGGKKPGLMDSMKRSMTGRDAHKAMLNAEYLLSLDPASANYAEGLLKNASKAGYLETVKWVTAIVYDSLRKDKKPSKNRFRAFRDAMVAAAEQADQWNNNALEVWFLEQAIQSLDYAVSRMPSDEELKNEQRDLAGRFTIARGKYEDADDFRDSLHDAEKQKILHDSERAKQGDQSLEQIIESARATWEAEPESAGKLKAYIDVLTKPERKDLEDRAVNVLMECFKASQNYSHKFQADEIRLKQLTRGARKLALQARESNSEDDRQQARLAAMEQRQFALEVFRERVAKYPTDLRLKYRYGRALFEAGQYDESIPVLQEAVGDPRNRAKCQLMIGRAFFEKGNYGQAADELREAHEQYELTDEHSKELLYWLGRAYEAEGKTEPARETFGRLLRQDYNYRDGDARTRLENLKQTG